jgi:hypothetical protein
MLEVLLRDFEMQCFNAVQQCTRQRCAQGWQGKRINDQAHACAWPQLWTS